jgi:hypothetical protein
MRKSLTGHPGMAGENLNPINTMTEYLVKRTGKLLFPHLARDQRKNLMSTITLVLMFSLAMAVTVAKVILYVSRHH